MSKQGYIRRYSVILEKVENSHYPSRTQIMDFLEDLGFEISDRTFDRDIKELREEFGVELKYSMSKRGYYIDKTLSCTSESFYRFMEIASTSELIQESLKENKELFSLVSYESTGDLIGIQLLSKLLLAIRESRVIKFVHENFYTGRIGDFEIKPYFLKEYQSRWYIIGEVDWDKKFWNFGVDRIQDLEITDKVFKRKKADLEKLYEHTIGLNFNEPKPERVELLFNEIQIKYVRALQLHESQIEGETKDGFTAVDLYVRPNYEFMQKILMMGDGVEVIKPKWFRDQVKKVLKDTLSKYKK